MIRFEVQLLEQIDRAVQEPHHLLAGARETSCGMP